MEQQENLFDFSSFLIFMRKLTYCILLCNILSRVFPTLKRHHTISNLMFIVYKERESETITLFIPIHRDIIMWMNLKVLCVVE